VPRFGVHPSEISHASAIGVGKRIVDALPSP
jgi:hypothetical protein